MRQIELAVLSLRLIDPDQMRARCAAQNSQIFVTRDWLRQGGGRRRHTSGIVYGPSTPNTQASQQQRQRLSRQERAEAEAEEEKLQEAAASAAAAARRQQLQQARAEEQRREAEKARQADHLAQARRLCHFTSSTEREGASHSRHAGGVVDDHRSPLRRAPAPAKQARGILPESLPDESVT